MNDVADPKVTLHRYLQAAREALLWKLEGLSDYDARRPLTPTGTNVLGVVKHVASIELGYLGDCFGRPCGVPMPWFAPDAEPNADLWATRGESREQIVDLYRLAWTHDDATVDALSLEAVGSVGWWPPERRKVTLHQILVHVVAETNRHAGQIDVVRELIDGAVGLRPGQDNLPAVDEAWWAAHRGRLQAVAEEFRG